VISTCRDAGDVRCWLIEHGFPHRLITVTNMKPNAWLYVDDRGFRFGGNFAKVLAALDEKPWWAEQLPIVGEAPASNPWRDSHDTKPPPNHEVECVCWINEHTEPSIHAYCWYEEKHCCGWWDQLGNGPVLVHPALVSHWREKEIGWPLS
jgi:hypothetical protein